ncbi:hypothetical protein ACA910_021599 [Epithemia clementina (nom. ined.)]
MRLDSVLKSSSASNDGDDGGEDPNTASPTTDTCQEAFGDESRKAEAGVMKTAAEMVCNAFGTAVTAAAVVASSASYQVAEENASEKISRSCPAKRTKN